MSVCLGSMLGDVIAGWLIRTSNRSGVKKHLKDEEDNSKVKRKQKSIVRRCRTILNDLELKSKLNLIGLLDKIGLVVGSVQDGVGLSLKESFSNRIVPMGWLATATTIVLLLSQRFDRPNSLQTYWLDERYISNLRLIGTDLESPFLQPDELLDISEIYGYNSTLSPRSLLDSQDSLNVFLMITSSWNANSFHSRQKFRNSSLQFLSQPTPLKLSYRFIIGLPPNPHATSHLAPQVLQESQKYGDILMVPAGDSYEDLSKKVYGGFSWAKSQKIFDYVLKTDDDMFLRLDIILKELSDLGKRHRYWKGLGYWQVVVQLMVLSAVSFKVFLSYD
jgi:hypothetical protein